LPQGGVTSPSISNIICIKLDNRISGYVGKRNITFSRYADDMVFSSLSEKRLLSIKNFVINIIKEEGFAINAKKTRIMRPHDRREVTGLVVNEELSVGIGKRTRRILRAKVHTLLTKTVDDKSKNILNQHIRGWFSFLSDVDKGGYNSILKYVKKIEKKFKQEGILTK
jgi:retron-type reverse transcriptase